MNKLTMSKQTLADYLDVSEDTIDRRVRMGELPAGVRMGGKTMWLKDQIDATIHAHFGIGGHDELSISDKPVSAKPKVRRAEA